MLLLAGVDFQIKQLLVDGKQATPQIWDTAGQEVRAQGREAQGCGRVPAAAPQQPVIAPATVTAPAFGTGTSPSPNSAKPWCAAPLQHQLPQCPPVDQGHQGGKGTRGTQPPGEGQEP